MNILILYMIKVLPLKQPIVLLILVELLTITV